MHARSGQQTGFSLEKLKRLDACFDRQLERYAGKKRDPETPSANWKNFLRKWLFRVCLLLFGLFLPFLVLIWGSLFVYYHFGLNGWLALGSGIAATTLLLMIYGAGLSYTISGRAKINKYVARSITVLVISYCCYGLLYLSSLNVKSDEVRAYYRTVHPILRVTLATARLADPDLIITDMQRTPDDYEAMGLNPLRRSLHYEQSTGYVHAVDLRTVGRPAWKNWMTRHGLNLLGYKTIRHRGTADHLHVALPLND